MLMCRTFRPAVVAGASLVTSFLLAALQAPLHAAQSQRETTFESAEFVLSEDKRPPGDTAAWQPISLPHEWRRTHPGITGQGWYRIKFNLPQTPANAQAINVNYASRLGRTHFFVNGALLGGSRDITASAAVAAYGTPFYVFVPPALLRAGENVLHARTHTTSYPINVEGLGRVTFGDARPVRRIAVRHVWGGYYAAVAFLAMAFGAGLITLFVWFARRSDRVILWFSIACLSWSLAGILKDALRWSDLGPLNPILSLYVNYGLVVPAIILCLRSVDLKWIKVEAALWAFLVIQVTYPLWLDRANLFVRLGWDVTNTMLLLAGLVILLVVAKRPLGWPYKLEAAALFLMAFLMSYEVVRYLGWVDPESVSFRQYHVPVMLLAIGAAIFERHVAAIWRMEQTNFELERRVTEKAREIESYHAERAEASRQQALAYERQRIITDMHDGLGASLVGLLRYVQNKAPDGHVEQRVKEALQELRIAIDALEPSEGDLGAVLGNLRYRLEPLLEPAGIRLTWDVGELPRVEALEPSAVFALQRIVLEAVANALKHSAATHVRLSAQATATGGVEIQVEDDGRGFEVSQSTAGLGLANMRARAARLGAHLEIASCAGHGTVVRLQIPRALARLSEDRASGKPDARALHDLVPAPGVA